MKSLILTSQFIITCLFGLKAQEQYLALERGEPLSALNTAILDKVLQVQDGSVTALFYDRSLNSDQGNAYGLVQFDSELNVHKKVNLSLSLPYERKYVDCLTFSGEIVLFSSYYNQEKHVEYLMKQTIDPVTLVPNTDLTVVAERKPKLNTIQIFGSLPKFKVLPYGDGEKLVCLFYTDSGENGVKHLSVLIVNGEFKPLWTSTIEMKNELLLDRVKVVLNGSGHCYLYNVPYSLREGGSLESLYHSSEIVYRITDSGRKVENYSLRVEDQFISNLNVLTANDLTYVWAYYSRKEKGEAVGVMLTIIYDDGSTKKVEVPFTAEIMARAQMEWTENRLMRRLEKGKSVDIGIDDLHPWQSLQRMDGSLLLIGQRREYYSPSSSGSISQFFKYGDLVLVSVNADGQLQWFQVLDKYQLTDMGSQEYGSYSNFADGSTIKFIYSDKSKPVLSIVDEEGEVTHIKQNPEQSVSGIYCVGEAVAEDDNVYFFHTSANVFRIVRLSHQE